jgi:hypothetical protein
MELKPARLKEEAEVEALALQFHRVIEKTSAASKSDLLALHLDANARLLNFVGWALGYSERPMRGETSWRQLTGLPELLFHYLGPQAATGGAGVLVLPLVSLFDGMAKVLLVPVFIDTAIALNDPESTAGPADFGLLDI